MSARPDLLEEADEVRGVVVEGERAVAQRNVAGVVPVGNIDVMFGQQSLDRGAEQRREVTRQRRDQQNARRRLVDVFLEMAQRREGRNVCVFLGHRDFAVADHDALDAIGWPGMGQPRPHDQFIGGVEVAESRRPR